MSIEMYLPKGWRREERARKLGLSAGKVEVFYSGPDGRRYRSKQQLSHALGDQFDLTAFDFRTGKLNPVAARKARQQLQHKTTGHVRGYPSYDYLRGLKTDAAITGPARQTASIFKQPVTVVRHIKESATKQQPPAPADSKANSSDKSKQQPSQLFWERRLQGLGTSDPSGAPHAPAELPRGVRGVSLDLGKDTLLRSVATALHSASGPVVGQLHAKGQQDRHPAVYINPQQPLVQALIVTEEDIRKQEEQVVAVRKQLQLAFEQLRNIVEQ